MGTRLTATLPDVAYRELPPPAGMRGLVECGWVSAGAPSAGPVLPDGCMDLIWTGAELLVAGPDTGPHPPRSAPDVAATGLRFAPGRLPALLGVPASAVRDQRVPLAALLPHHARRAVARLEHGVSPAVVLAALAVALPGGRPEPGVPAVLGHLGAARSAAATADALGWTTRTLHRRCLESFGYGPAVLRRVLRFRRAVALLDAGLPPADVAARAGYADQPHLSREVRALAGRAPGSWSRPSGG